MANKKLITFDSEQLESVADALRETEFSFKGIEKETEEIVRNSTKQQFTSEGAYGAQFGFDPWPKLADSTVKQKERLNFGNKQILERTGALKEVLLNPSVSTTNNGFTIEATFSGEHAGLIPIHQKTRPLVILTEPDFDELGKLAFEQITKDFAKKLKSRKVRSRK